MFYRLSVYCSTNMLALLTDRCNIYGMWFVTTRCAHLKTDSLLLVAFHKTAMGHRFAANYNTGFVIATTIFCTDCSSYRGWKDSFYLK
jgi:hypothetical protein